MKIVLFAPLLLPPAGYFRAMQEADLAVIDTSMRYDKRFKAIHRTPIGPQSNTSEGSFLNIPISSSHANHCNVNDITVSPHGEWWRVWRMTLSTLYGPTPYFDLYRHDFFPLIDEKTVGRPITDINIDFILTVRRLCGITTPLSVNLDERYSGDTNVEITDLRRQDFRDLPDSVSVLDNLFKEGQL